MGHSFSSRLILFITEIAEVERLIGMQDDLTIAGLCKGIDTTETENKSLEMRGFLEGMKARRRQSAERASPPITIGIVGTVPASSSR